MVRFFLLPSLVNPEREGGRESAGVAGSEISVSDSLVMPPAASSLPASILLRAKASCNKRDIVSLVVGWSDAGL